jgi:hypothetical protein
MSISFNRGPVWGTWRRARLPGTLRGGGALWMKRLSLWRGSVEGVWGSCFIGDPGRCVGNVSGCGRLSLWGPLSSRGEPGLWGGSYTGDFVRWMEEGSSGGASTCEGFHVGDPGGTASLPGNLKDGVFDRLARFPVDVPISPWGPCWGIWMGFVYRDFWEIRKVYLGSFLGPRFINPLAY